LSQVLNITYYGVTAQNSWAEWSNVLLGGTYTLNVGGIEATSYGIVTVSIDGITVGTVDCYGTATAGKVWQIPGIVVTPGLHVVRITNASKNPTSSGFSIRLTSAAFNRTA
jgi:hypothetical protein